MVLYAIIIGLVIYYLLVLGWYYRLKRQPPTAEKQSHPKPDEGSLVGATRFRSGLISTTADSCGHFPQGIENETTFTPDMPDEVEETALEPDFEMTFEEPDEADTEEEEIALYLMNNETELATGVEFDKLGAVVRTANANDATEEQQQDAADTLTRIAGTNLYEAVVANINGGVERVAELLKRSEAAAQETHPAVAAENPELQTFDMNDFL